jgi:hypothetical protein
MDKCNVRKVAKDQGHQANSFSKEDNCQPLIGLVDKGVHCYGAMSPIYEIYAESEHYTFMHLTNLVRMEIKLKSMEEKKRNSYNKLHHKMKIKVKSAKCDPLPCQ